MNRSHTQLSSPSRWNNLMCALTTVALLSASYWANSSQLQQASPEISPNFSTDYLVLVQQ